MRFQYTPYMLPPLFSACIILALAVYAWRHRDVRGALAFGVCMLVSTLWAGGYGLELAGADLPTKAFWARVEYVGYALDAVVWLIMVFLFTGRDHWVTWRHFLPLSVPAVLSVLLAFSNGLHGLVWRNTYLDTNGPFTTMGRTFGPLFWIIFAYSWLLAMTSVPFLLVSLRRKSGFYREQARALLAGLVLLFVPHVLYNLGIYPRYDMTPVAAGVGGLIVGWSIFRHRLFDVVPVARENIVESMADGLIILDGQNRIVDLNPAARNIFGLSLAQTVGREAAAVFQDWPVLRLGREKPRTEMVMTRDGYARTFEVSCSSLQGGQVCGSSILLHDVTERNAAQNRLLEQQRALAAAQERERLARELHDSLAQVLGYLNVQAQAIHEYVTRGQADLAASGLERLGRIARDTHSDVREYIQSMRGDMELTTSLQNYLERYRRNYGIKTRLNVTGDALLVRIDPAAARQVLRIVQEALTNARKHAGASLVTVTFTEREGYVRVVVEDDGCGFVLEEGTGGGHFGLGIMKERAREAGGDLTIRTEPGGGTMVELVVPLSGVGAAPEKG